MTSPGSRRLEQIRSAVTTYQSRLIAFAARITGDTDSAREVVQETFLRLCGQDVDAIAGSVCSAQPAGDGLDLPRKEPFDDDEEVAPQTDRVAHRRHLLAEALDEDVEIEARAAVDLGDRLEVVLVAAQSFHQHEIVPLGDEEDELP